MARRIEININGVTYSGDTAPARDQLEMLNTISQCGLLASVAAGTSDSKIMIALSLLDVATVDRLKELAIRNGGLKRDADGVPVAENLFQDEIHLFLLLLGKVLQENIGPFWQFNGGESVPAEREAMSHT